MIYMVQRMEILQQFTNSKLNFLVLTKAQSMNLIKSTISRSQTLQRRSEKCRNWSQSIHPRLVDQYYFWFIFHLFISFSKIIQNFNIYIYTYIHTHTDTHMHAYAYICVYTVYAYTRVHMCIIVYISTTILRENRTCRRLRVLSSSPENILK